MQLKITRNLGRGLPDWSEGELVDLEDRTLARKLIKAGLAELVGGPVEADLSTDPLGPPPAKTEPAKTEGPKVKPADPAEGPKAPKRPPRK